MTDYEIYKEFLAEADRDDRVGDNDFTVTAKEDGTWPSGDTYTRIRGQLTTAGGAKADFNMNPLPTPEQLAGAASWETGKKRGVAQGINMHKALEKFYGKTVETLEIGDEIRVKCVKNKEGFIRIAAILDPNAKSAEPKAKASGAVPF
jgi:hypothetical protein